MSNLKPTCIICKKALNGQVVAWEVEDNTLAICSGCFSTLELSKVSGPTRARATVSFLIGCAIGVLGFFIVIQFSI